MNIEELLKKYGLTRDDVDFETEGLSESELEARFAQMQNVKFDGDGDEPDGGAEEGGDDGDNAGEATEPETDPEPQPEPEDDDDDAPDKRRFGLTGEQMWNEIIDALHAVMYSDEWGSWPRYCYTDYDPAAMEIYAYDNEDWNLYGFKYTMNGDKVVIDFESKTRKKLAFVDFDSGSAEFNYKHMFDSMNERFARVASEVATLREFKASIDQKERQAKVDEVFAQFEDLAENESFKALKENCGDMSVEAIEDKCFAIRGRNVKVTFSQNAKPVRLCVERAANNDADEPYGGLFVEFGIGNR